MSASVSLPSLLSPLPIQRLQAATLVGGARAGTAQPRSKPAPRDTRSMSVC